MKERNIIHIDADAFFASVEKSFNPILSDKPVIVGGEENQRACVHTASYEARMFGVKTGMPIQIAKNLCPEAVCLKGDFRRYRAVSETIKRILYRITPYVEVSSLDDVYIDVTGFKRFFDSIYEVTNYIKSEIYKELKITVSIGAATSKLVARIASARNKPDGITIVPSKSEKEFISKLPVSELPGIGRASERLLKGIGIKTIGDITKVSRDLLIQLFGINGKKIWEYANCIDNSPVKVKEISKQISRETSFEENTDNEEIIIGTIAYLSERIAHKLRENCWVCGSVRLKLLFSDQVNTAHSHVLSEVTDDSGIIFKEIMRIYKKIHFRRICLRLVSVAVGKIERKYKQAILFQNESKKERLNKKIDTVRYKFGFTSVYPANTMPLKTKYRMEKHGYILHAPSLSQ